jgi:uncharacterized protein (DUF433 family)
MALYYHQEVNMECNGLLKRIGVNPRVMVGKPVIKGTRLTVQYILKLIASGMSNDDIKDEYPGLQDDDIKACMFYASFWREM